MAYQLKRPKLVVVRRESRTSDGAGGKTVLLTTIAQVMADVEIPRTTDMQRFEPPPGISTAVTQLFVFVQPAPAIRINDLLVVGESTFRCKFLRSFDNTLQVDAWDNI
jgi:16S rRNA A1518/A1519 N6-dimethyltransferase RsmA/KsgA/DIM1 with predicted DNA glycosylase/AP lyase activity